MAFEIGRIARFELGYVGEGESRVIEVDVSEWRKRWLDAIFAITVQRPKETELYIAATETEGDILRWTVTAADVAKEGKGLAQIRAIKPLTGQCYMTRVVGTRIDWSLGGNASVVAPDPAQNWVNQVILAAKRAEDAADRAESAGGGGTVLPAYWQEHMDKRVEEIRRAMEAAGWQKNAFLWYHDVHWTYGYQMAPKLLKYLYQHTPINRTAFGGDIVDNEGDAEQMAYIWDWREQLRGLPNHHSVPGNHDDGNAIDNRWDDPYIYAYLLAAEETPEVVRGDAGLYYHIDVPTERTRYLYLDTATKDGNIINDSEELAWLQARLKDTPDGWHIIAIAHIWRTVDYDVDPPEDAGWSWGGQACITEFEAYNARSGIYAGCTGKVEACFGGHTHVDGTFFTDGGIPVILTEGDSRYVRSGLSCQQGTITEASVNAIVVDYAAEKISVIRIGRGKSRTVYFDGTVVWEDGTEDAPVEPDEPEEELTPPTGDFTNTLLEVGYEEGMRYSSDAGGGEDVPAEGWDITGYIPAKRGDVIRMLNVQFLDLYGEAQDDVSRAMVYLFNADKGYITCSANYDPDNLMSAAWNAVYGEDGDLIQFTIPTSYSSSTAYIRIGAKDIRGNSVITVNEEIIVTG